MSSFTQALDLFKKRIHHPVPKNRHILNTTIQTKRCLYSETELCSIFASNERVFLRKKNIRSRQERLFPATVGTPALNQRFLRYCNSHQPFATSQSRGQVSVKLRLRFSHVALTVLPRYRPHSHSTLPGWLTLRLLRTQRQTLFPRTTQIFRCVYVLHNQQPHSLTIRFLDC